MAHWGSVVLPLILGGAAYLPRALVLIVVIVVEVVKVVKKQVIVLVLRLQMRGHLPIFIDPYSNLGSHGGCIAIHLAGLLVAAVPELRFLD